MVDPRCDALNEPSPHRQYIRMLSALVGGMYDEGLGSVALLKRYVTKGEL